MVFALAETSLNTLESDNKSLRNDIFAASKTRESDLNTIGTLKQVRCVAICFALLCFALGGGFGKLAVHCLPYRY